MDGALKDANLLVIFKLQVSFKFFLQLIPVDMTPKEDSLVIF